MPSTLLQSCPERSTLELPFWNLLLLLCILCWFRLLLSAWNRRRLLEVLNIGLPVSRRVEDFPFRLKHFFTNFFVFLNDIDVELSSAALRALHQLYFLVLFLIIAECFLDPPGDRLRLIFSVFFSHLSLKNCHEILVGFQRGFLIWIVVLFLLRIRLFFNRPIFIIYRFCWYWRRLLLSYLRSWLFCFLFISILLLLLHNRLFKIIRFFFFSLLHGSSLIFLSTHTSPNHFFLK